MAQFICFVYKDLSVIKIYVITVGELRKRKFTSKLGLSETQGIYIIYII